MERAVQSGSSRLGWIAAALLLLGLYLPSDTAPHLTVLTLVAYGGCFTLLALLILRRDGHPAAPVTLLLLSITPLLLLFTFTSGLTTMRLGALAPFGLLSVLLVTNLRDVVVPPWFQRFWAVVNVVNIGAGFAIVIGVEPFNDFLIRFYSTAYEGLVPAMLAMHKPVLTFGSHSIAAFFLYLFFWLNFEGYRRTRRRLWLGFALGYVVLLPFLLSVTALVFTLIALGQLAVHSLSFFRRRTLWVVVTAGLLLVVLLGSASQIDVRGPTEVVREILNDPNAGLTGRLARGGTMYEAFQYVQEHPFSPVGTGFREGFMFGDNGPVEYLLRGSLPLVLLVYGGFFYFLRRNLLTPMHAYVLFAATLAFEMGITVLITARALYLLPAFCVFLNSLPAPAQATVRPSGGSQ